MPRPLPARALELLDAGRDWEAERLLAQLERAGVRDPRLLRTLGWAKLGLGDAAGAATCAREALARAPNSWESHYALGMALRVSDVAAAERALDDALQHSRANRHCLLALSACALVRGDAGAAERFAREALEARPEDREARNALGAALLTARKFEGAAEAFPDAAEILGEPESIERETLGRGVALRLAGRFREAIDYYEAVLPAAPSIEALGQYSLALLAIGDLPTAWQPYSFRWFEPGLRAQRASYPVPMWAGQSLAGRTVLLRCEQGVGDVIQFIRYAPLVKARGATVLLELRPGLGALANAFPGVDAAFTPGETSRTFDYWIGLLDLPWVFGTALDAIPAETPYLRTEPQRVERWRERLASYDGLKVGLVWAGDPRHPHDRERSIPLDMLAPLTGIAGVNLFSLQKGPAAAALASASFARAIVDLGNSLDD
ncbi:MAG: tetratricopeptide repeat protein, partial [Proteobacteria bacterium]|nr:tetratricopeptide repeat protein [Pseudomonadota bacterium]